MALTQSCDIFAAVQDAGIDRLVHHVFRQRPSLINYATAGIAGQPERLCRPIDAHPIVAIRGNPFVTVLPPLPIALTDGALSVDFSVQVTAVELDVHPGDVISLPSELSTPLRDQRLALHAGACVGFGCPSDDIVDRLRPSGGVPVGAMDRRRLEPVVLPSRDLLCTCVDVFTVLGADLVGPRGGQQVAARFDGLEIVDLGPTELENTIECYVGLVVRLGVLPRLQQSVVEIPPLPVGELFTIEVEPTPSDVVPNNPALEDNQVKIFLDVTTGPGQPAPSPQPPGPPGPKPPPRGNPRARTRTGPFDATVAASEKAIQTLFDAVRANFRLQSSGAKDFGAPSGGFAVERAHGDFYFLGELTPIDHTVVAALEDKGISVLDTIGIHVPLVRVVRAVEIGAVAGRQETAGPDVELGLEFESRHGIQYPHLVGALVIFGVEHELDLVSDRPAHVEADTVEQELVGRLAAVRFVMRVAGSQAGANRNWTQLYLRP